MPKKKRVPQKYTYYAFYHDKTVKLGYTKDVVDRLRQLGGASSCFICFRAEHDSTKSAQEAEKQTVREQRPPVETPFKAKVLQKLLPN